MKISNNSTESQMKQHYDAIMSQVLDENKGVINYQKYCDTYHFNYNMFKNNERTELSDVLNDVCDFYFEQFGGIMISVIIVNKETRLPGEGFFEHARKKGILKIGVPDKQFFEEQKNRLLKKFKKK